MSKVKEGVLNVLRGRFLVNDDSLNNWGFITFIVFLMLLMISSSHRLDKKVMRIAKLSKEVKELRAQFVDLRSISMKAKLESTVKKNVEVLGLGPGETPPKVIKVVLK